MEAHVFDGLTGAHLRRLSVKSGSWQDAVNEVGSLSLSVRDDGLVPKQQLRPYGTILAVIDDGVVRHAGYLTHWKHDRVNGIYDLEAGGGGTILDKRLVLNYALKSAWKDGNVLIDEDNPPGNWVLAAKGSYSDLIRALIVETEKWGDLPITPAAATGGNRERNWECWALAKVIDRISDIGDLEDGPEWRFDPVLSSNGYLSFKQVTSADGGEIIDRKWVWNATVPNSGVVLGEDDEDGTDMCGACYATGGKSEDRILIAHRVGTVLTSKGWPLLQTANTEHSTVSVLSTLQSYAAADVRNGDSPQLTSTLYVPADWQVHVGDWADVRYGHGEGDVLQLKVTDVYGSWASGRQTLGVRER